MVENLLVFDIFACHFLPIAQSLHINLRWLGMRVQSENEAVIFTKTRLVARGGKTHEG
jgi:hypothetical protein